MPKIISDVVNFATGMATTERYLIPADRLGPGDKVCVPAGFEGEWEVLEHTRKIYVIYENTAG